MTELLRTNDAVLISYVQALLSQAGIEHLVADNHISILDGSIGAIPRRILVDDDDISRARRVLTENGLGHELRDPS